MAAETEREPPGIGIEEKLGQKVPTNISFLDESGKAVKLQHFFSARRPVILVPSYYTCTRLCTFIFEGVKKAADAAAANGMNLGRDYNIVSLSINPQDDPQSAHEKGESIRASFENIKVSAKSWHFLSGKEEDVRLLMNALGYRYRWDPSGGPDISHTAAIVLLSPQAAVMRYLYGIQFAERDFRLSLIEAANGKIGSVMEKVILYCFRYDPVEGKYTPIAWAFMRIGGVLTLCFLAALWFFLYRKARKK